MGESVIIVSYPKSGSTFLSRLIGDALNSPVDGVADAVPLAKEGANRKGTYPVFQTHLAAHHMGKEVGLVYDRFQFNVDRYDPTRHIVIHLVRDPRAIAVSAQHYWEIPSLEEALDAMYHAGSPIQFHYDTFMRDWLETQAYLLRYEDLIDNPQKQLIKLFWNFRIPYSIRRVRRAIERQEFSVRRKELEASGDTYPYSCGIQAHNLRSGKKNNWRLHFTDTLNQKAVTYFGDIMNKLDYAPTNTSWEIALAKLQEVFTILPDAGMRKCEVLYNLASQMMEGALVELGVAQGRGALSMALGTKDSGYNLPVYAVDDYQDHLDWANLKYDESNLDILRSNAETLGVPINVVQEDAMVAGDNWEHEPVALWCWDVSTSAEALWHHWVAWHLNIKQGGIAFVRDLFDKRFDSDRVKMHALENGFIVELEEAGILLLRKI